MTLSLRRRIAIVALAASATALLAVLLLVVPGLRRRTTEDVRERLLAAARLVAQLAREPLARGAGIGELDALADQAGVDVRARVTIIGADGRVLGDSSVSGEALRGLENHATRPEVRDALRLGEGQSIRRSATVGDDLLYVAVPIRHAGAPVGVARVAVPLTGVTAHVAALRDAVAIALLWAFGLTAMLSALFARSLAGPLAELMDAARRFAAGDIQARLRTPRRDELGELARILDQSAERLQERLAASARDRARTEAILKAMEDGVLALDHRGIVALANDALRASLELDEPVSRHYLEAIRQREVGEVIQAVLKTGERQQAEIEIRHLRRCFAVAGVPYPGDGDAPHGAVLTFHDVTERRRVERLRRDFVANASHELRTPLTSIRGFVEALEDGALQDPPTARRFLGKVRTHADRMAALVQDLLELSRLEAGERPLRLEPVAPQQVAADVLASFRRVAAAKDVALTPRDLGSSALVTDADRLRRILENLVDNAIKYTPAGGSVEVCTRPLPDGGARVEVRDDGPGIAAEHLPRLFERFYRADKARSREIGGTGLGLAIVKHLAEGMGASVSVESALGKGSCFSVALPAAPPGELRSAS